jgi:hypothetical protein
LSAAGRLAVIVAALLLYRVGSAALVVVQPGYTDAYYYADVAKRLADGQGLSAAFIWNFLEATPGGALPVPSHRFWMPLATVLQSIGISILPFLDAFGAAQAIEIFIACFIPVVAYRATRTLGASIDLALVAAVLAGLGGAFAPGWVSLDAFAPAAIIGTLFFIAYGRAARGNSDAGAVAGILVGLLFLARAEGALFGLPLLALVRAPRTRAGGIAGSVIALGIGLGWLVRDATLGTDPQLFARTVLLVRYEDFFATQAPTWAAFVAALPDVLAAKVAALGVNAITFAFAFGLLLVPGIVAAIRARRADPAVRAFAVLAGLVFLLQSLVVTLHSTRGSYFHSLAAFLPFGVALGTVGTASLIGRLERGPRMLSLARTAAAGGVIAAIVLSTFAVMQWDTAFNVPYRARAAQAALIPSGRFMAIDAAAWRWIARRPTVVTPADLSPCAIDRASRSAVKWLVLERTHFSAYDGLYRGTAVVPYLTPAGDHGDLKVFAIDLKLAAQLCAGGQ